MVKVILKILAQLYILQVLLQDGVVGNRLSITSVTVDQVQE